MRFAPLLLAISLAAPSAALAQTAPAASPQAETGTAKPEKKICRREEGVGSRLGKRVCMTREQWAGAAEQGSASTSRDPSQSEEGPR